jgi:hypothetical protein
MLKSFDGQNFKNHGIIDTFLVDLGGNIVSIEVKVVDSLLEYNILQGHSCFYMMKSIVLSVFRVQRFSQLEYCTPNSITNVDTNIPFIIGSTSAYC